MKPVQIGDIAIGGGSPLALIAGPCVIEGEAHARSLAGALAEITRRLNVPFIFKASFDKANRTSGKSFRGPGLAEGLRVLAAIKAGAGVAILTDIHEPAQAAAAADVADVLQIPAFLCRQTDLLVAAARTGRAINIKKGQFLAPDDVRHAVAKVVDAGNARVFVTERGTSFGYHNLVVDMRAFPMIRETGVPVVFDVTHSLQLPGGGDGVTSGQAEYIEPLASAGVGAGVDGVFLEVHEEPRLASSRRARTAAAEAHSHRRDRQASGHHHAGPWLIAPSPGRCFKPKPLRFSRSSIASTIDSIGPWNCSASVAAA
jgi:2-dehydro-3-deoxyphosphooctonate aldolase (KDO 8-P synthase)